MITRLNGLNQCLSGPECDMNLRPIAQQQSIHISAGVQQITIHNPVSNRGLVQRWRIVEDLKGKSVMRSLIVARQHDRKCDSFLHEYN
jgi:hypothetical protein